MAAEERLLALGLAAGRIVIGAGLWLAPQLASDKLGFGRLDDRALALARLAGTRDVVLGATQLAAIDDPDRLRRATAAAALADAGDTIAFALALASADRPTRTAGLRGLPVAAAATAAGGWLISKSK